MLLHLFLRFFFSFLAILLRSKFREKLPSVGVTPQMACLYVFVATNLARSRIKSYFSQLQENVSLGKPSKFNKGGPHSYSFHFPSIGNVPLLPCLGESIIVRAHPGNVKTHVRFWRCYTTQSLVQPVTQRRNKIA